MSYLVGVGLWWTWGSWCWFLDDSPRDHLSFLGQDSGGNSYRSLSSFRSRLKYVWLNSHYHFLHWWWSFAKEYIRSSWKKVEWLPSAGHGFWTISLLQTGWVRIRQMQRMEDVEGWMRKFSTSSSVITYSGSICCSRGPRAFLNTCVFHIPHQVLKPIDENVKDRLAGIGMWRSSNML